MNKIAVGRVNNSDILLSSLLVLEGKKGWQMNGATECLLGLVEGKRMTPQNLSFPYEAAFRNREDYSNWHLTCDFVKIDTPTLGLYYENYCVI